MFASQAADWALLIGASAAAVGVLATAAATIIAALSQARRDRVLDSKVDVIHREVQGVHGELRTLNGQTVGQLADAQETRRADAIPIDERTTAEADHLLAVPPPSD